jgi:F0F1-type ATP synthase membrane subunit b/b'
MLYQIKKEAFDALSEDLKKEYTLDGENATLKIEGEGAPTLAAITKAEEKHRIAEEHRKAAEKARDAAEAASEKLREDLGNASGKKEIEELNKKHTEELEKIREARETEKAAAKEMANANLKKETAEEFRNNNFVSGKLSSLVGKEFTDRLSVEEVNGESVIRVLDPDGKPSALSLNELKQEFLANKEFATIIKVDTGSGGGANPSGGGGAAKKQLSEMNATEESIFANEHPEEYAQMTGSEG